MPATSDSLAQFSSALVSRVSSAKTLVAAIRLSDGRHLSATQWRGDLLVASEQALPKRDEFEIVLSGGPVEKAQLIGRDSATNVALLKLAQATPATAVPAA